MRGRIIINKLSLYLIPIAGIAIIIVLARLYGAAPSQRQSQEALKEKEYLSDMLKEVTFEKGRIEEELKALKSAGLEKTAPAGEKEHLLSQVRQLQEENQLLKNRIESLDGENNNREARLNERLKKASDELTASHERQRQTEEQLRQAADINSSMQQKLKDLAKLLAIETADTDKQEAIELGRRLEAVLEGREMVGKE